MASRLSRNFRYEDYDADEGLWIDNQFTFEVAWEVANKVGGIYTVIKSKAMYSVETMGNDYCLLGPYVERNVRTEMDIIEEIPNLALRDTIQELRDNGIHVVYGRWLIEGYPKAVLFDLESTRWRIDGAKADFWNATHIGVPADPEAENAILFGHIVAWFIGSFRARCAASTLVVSHFHEWQAGAGLILLRTRHVDVATVFTTHATLLGRYLCASNVDFYNNLSSFDVDKEAGERNIYHRYCMERSACHCAHVFTTVSRITADEAEHLLKRKADVIVPNGLNVVRFSAMHEFQNLHAKNKEKINAFVQGHFSGYYDFDLDKTLYFFSAGRYEFTNKGADLYLESLARLNHMLKASGSDVTVVAFLIFPTPTNNFNVESLRSQASTKQLRDIVQGLQDRVGRRIFESALAGNLPDNGDLLTSEDLLKLKRCIYEAQRPSLPAVVTHNVIADSTDPILSTIRRLELFNKREDRVKVIFHPEFLKSTNPLIGLDYEEFVRGCHLGVFPSYYEPWGYTPAECTLMGIPSITTNLSGFGCFMAEHVANPEMYGIYIVDRRLQGFDSSVLQLAQYMYQFCQFNRRQRIIQRNRTERLSDLLDWNSLGRYYQQARRLAIAAIRPGTQDYEIPDPADYEARYPKPASIADPQAYQSDVDDVDDDMEDQELSSVASSRARSPEPESPSDYKDKK
eukprot:scpid35121/ scgid10304/ Putative glycogen [starch] synthase